MKLVYSNRRFNQLSEIHRFDALGEFTLNDLEVLYGSIAHFLHRLSKDYSLTSILIIDLSDSDLRVEGSKIQEFEIQIQSLTSSFTIPFIFAQTDIESMNAETMAVERSLEQRLHRVENKVTLMDSIKKQVSTLRDENRELRSQITVKNPSNPIKARNFYDKLWGDS